MATKDPFGPDRAEAAHRRDLAFGAEHEAARYQIVETAIV
jgi:hypothetical protein